MNTEATEAPASTALTVIERAALALGAAEHERRLVELSKASTDLVAVTNPASYQQIHGARMSLKRARVEIEKTGDAARQDARAFAGAVITEQKRLIAIIEPEEGRLQAIQEAHDAKVEAEKEAKAAAERERLARIQAAIAEIKDHALASAGLSAVSIAEMMELLEKVVIGTDRFGDFCDVAQEAKVATMNKLQQMHAAAVDQEAEAKRLAEERAQLERDKAEQAERERVERERLQAAKEQAEAIERAARENREAEERASRERIEAQERTARQEREEADRVARVAREAEEARHKQEMDAIAEGVRRDLEKLEGERLAAEERERKKREAAESKALAKAAKEAEAERERLRKEADKQDARAMLDTWRQRFRHIKEYSPVIAAADRWFDEHPQEAPK